MRFVFLTLGYTPDLDGGGYRYATEVAELLAARGHEVHALYPNPDEKLPTRERRRGVELHRLSRGKGGFLSRWRAANRAARTRVNELLRVGSQSTLLFSHHAYLEPALRGLPYVMMLHGPWALEHRFACRATPRSWVQRWVDRWACGLMARTERRSCAGARQVLVASEYSRLKLRDWHPGLRVQAEVIGGGADLVRFRPAVDRGSVRASLGLAPGDFLFLTVRRLDPRMGLKLVLEAFAEMTAEFPSARLWLAGRGRQQQELEAQINAHQLGERVRLLGFVPEERLAELYAAADCVLMPSLDLEGFGLVTAEALACGTPVAASRAGANAEVIEGLSADLLFPAGDVAALATKLRQILREPQSLPSRDRCAAYAREQFRWERPADACDRAGTRWAIPPAERRAL
jgi:glycosyltransferase involved in cell wall biosynthesis